MLPGRCFSIFVSLIALLSAEVRASSELPGVGALLSRATGKVKAFATKAADIQARVAKRQIQQREALKATKASYERKLEAQATENQALVYAIVALEENISAADEVNTHLGEDSKKLRKDNDLMYQALSTLKRKVIAAKLFLNNSVHVTDDNKAAALLILDPPKPKPALANFLAVTGSAAQHQKQSSLLQLRSQRSALHERAEDLVPAISQSLADLSSADQNSKMQLKASFLLAWGKAERRRQELNATREEIITKRDALQSHQGELREAKAHLLSTRKQLQQRLQAVHVFAKSIGSATASTLTRVSASSAAIAKAANSPTPTPVAMGKKTKNMLHSRKEVRGPKVVKHTFAESLKRRAQRAAKSAGAAKSGR